MADFSKGSDSTARRSDDGLAALPSKASAAVLFFRGIVDRTVDSWEAGIDIICHDAPHIIVAHAPEGRRRDCTIALAYLELAAPPLGLGACWAGWLDAAANNWESLQQYLELPEGHTCCGAMMIGYAKYRYHRIPLRDEAQITWQ